MGTGLLMVVVVLLLFAIYQIELLRQRVERLHAKVNAVRKAIAPDEQQRDAETADLRSVIDTAR